MIVSGYATPYIINNLFVNNTAEHNGGAVALKYYAGGYHINNTVVGNYSGNNGGAYSIGCYNDSCFFANNIIGGNTDLDDDYDQFYIKSPDDDMKFYNNDIEGGLTYTETVNSNNFDEDPEWIDQGNGDFRLACTSPCKDIAKDTLNYFPEFDLLGLPRLVDVNYDLGAYETQLAVPVDLGDDVNICEGSIATLDAGEGYETYMWNTTEETQTIDVLVAGTYTVTVSNAYLCTATDNVEVFVNPLPEPDLGDDVTICDGETATLDPGAGFETYLWNTSEDTQTIDVTTAGTYSVTVTNAFDCAATDSVEVFVNPATEITQQPVSQEDIVAGTDVTFSVEATGAGTLTYQWRKDETPLADGGNISGATTSELTITAVSNADAGAYDCVVTGDCGDVTSEDGVLSILVGLDDISTSGIFVYPNPTNGIFTIENAQDYDITISEVSGKIIYKSQINNNTKSIDLLGTSKGIYLINLKSNTQSSTIKLIIE